MALEENWFLSCQGSVLFSDHSCNVRSGQQGASLANSEWRLIRVPSELTNEECYYIVDNNEKFLDTHGHGPVAVWGNGGVNVVIAGNRSQYAANLRWYLLPCPCKTEYYIVNVNHKSFLRNSDSKVDVWNNGGSNPDEVIHQDNSHVIPLFPNLRWKLTSSKSNETRKVSSSSSSSSSSNGGNKVKILHLSDTHCQHWNIEKEFGVMPEADMLLHTGDFTQTGGEEEVKSFNNWLGSLRSKYKHIVVIYGNHEFQMLSRQNAELITHITSKEFLRQQLSNATAVLINETVEIEGVRIHGSGWNPWQVAGDPDQYIPKIWDNSHYNVTSGGEGQQRQQIPDEVDVLMTHEPARYILDCVENSKSTWGSSMQLREAIITKKPKVHLFGHLHEQNGHYQKKSSSFWSLNGNFEGGVRAKLSCGKIYNTIEKPPANYPCHVVSNSAMLGLNGRLQFGPRLIIGEGGKGGWKFRVVVT